MIFDKSYFSASGNHYWDQGEIIFKERPYPCYEQLIFLPVVTMFSFIFQRILSVIEKIRRKWFPIVGERLLYKKWLHLYLNNGFHWHKV